MRDKPIDDHGVEWYPVPPWLNGERDEEDEDEEMDESKERKYKVNGKLGVWRTVGGGADVFFPDDGSEPTGLPRRVAREIGKAKGASGDSEPGDKVDKHKRRPPYEQPDADPDKVAAEISKKERGLKAKSRSAANKAVKELPREDRETVDKIDEGGAVTEEEARGASRSLGAGVKRGLLGAAVLSMLPGIVGYAVATMLAISVARRMYNWMKSAVSENKKRETTEEVLARCIDLSLADLAGGRFSKDEYEKAIAANEKNESAGLGVLSRLRHMRSSLLESGDHIATMAELPDTIRAVLKKLGYHRREIRVVPVDSIRLRSMGGDGYRSFAAIVDVATGKHDIQYGSWGGPNPWSKSNPVDMDDKPYRIPTNGAVILGHEGGGRAVTATIHVPPEMLSGLLPIKHDLSNPQRELLKVCVRLGFVPSARGIAQAGASSSDMDYLVGAGYMSVDKGGTIRLTTKGKNAAH